MGSFRLSVGRPRSSRTFKVSDFASISQNRAETWSLNNCVFGFGEWFPWGRPKTSPRRSLGPSCVVGVVLGCVGGIVGCFGAVLGQLWGRPGAFFPTLCGLFSPVLPFVRLRRRLDDAKPAQYWSLEVNSSLRAKKILSGSDVFRNRYLANF